jgi:hypothetical protein
MFEFLCVCVSLGHFQELGAFQLCKQTCTCCGPPDLSRWKASLLLQGRGTGALSGSLPRARSLVGHGDGAAMKEQQKQQLLKSQHPPGPNDHLLQRYYADPMPTYLAPRNSIVHSQQQSQAAAITAAAGIIEGGSPSDLEHGHAYAALASRANEQQTVQAMAIQGQGSSHHQHPAHKAEQGSGGSSGGGNPFTDMTSDTVSPASSASSSYNAERIGRGYVQYPNQAGSLGLRQQASEYFHPQRKAIVKAEGVVGSVLISPTFSTTGSSAGMRTVLASTPEETSRR